MRLRRAWSCKARRRWIHPPTGLGDGDAFCLNKCGNLSCGNLNLRGVGDGTGIGVGVGDASPAGFLRVRLGFGEGAGDSAAEGDAVVSDCELVSIFLSVRYFGGDGDSMGVPVSSCDSTRTAQMVRPTTTAIESSLVAITNA